MIVPTNIPLDAPEFFERCRTFKRLGTFSKDGQHLRLLWTSTEELAKRQPEFRGLMEYLRRVAREKGEQRLHADADHIIPKSVWPVLMPRDLIQPPELCNLICNLCWRDSDFNRDEESDLFWIKVIKSEFLGIKDLDVATKRKLAHNLHKGVIKLWSQDWENWASGWVTNFLRVKHDESIPFPGVPIDPFEFHDMVSDRKLETWMWGD